MSLQTVLIVVLFRSRSPGEISRVENVAEEFFQLSVPRSSEILDVAAGSGIVSALLQTGGKQRPDCSTAVCTLQCSQIHSADVADASSLMP